MLDVQKLKAACDEATKANNAAKKLVGGPVLDPAIANALSAIGTFIATEGVPWAEKFFEALLSKYTP